MPKLKLSPRGKAAGCGAGQKQIPLSLLTVGNRKMESQQLQMPAQAQDTLPSATATTTPTPIPIQAQFSPHSNTTCCNCGGPTALAPPPKWSDVSPPPSYRPVRSPAINLPPNYSQKAIILSPVPQSQKVLSLSPPYLFQVPTKKITHPDDIHRFHESDSSKNFLGFIVALSESIRGHKISDHCHQSPTVNSIVSLLETLLRWVDEIPPVQQSSRYGNYSYRVWHGRMTENAESLMLQFIPNDLRSATLEIVPYFTDSFGNSTRIDYGTGHETNFAAWLYCLARLGLLKEEDYQAVVSRIFVKYLELMRKLQTVYCLEPAGSHGVWGLDDYHFLPFIFGSSQLIDHKYMKPKSIHNQDILDNFSNEYLYLSCISFVKKVKKGLFAEHSPLLDDISGVPTWNKVNSGMLKMYKAEVLEKVPVMQHFLFGWLIKWD
ncbi:PREDICTED: serine/threonine-protein phosphatase 2A activator-like [Nelumbo nucifera]|uniref:Serine/threonine-protein phosphatase 2A activator n=1 Tax=Nelumbo nucifera TaxID=4432 RepID=A0A1U8B1H6_NELNU|nr:PREDICTED: serine/threonine-protein phosphatase 2A activator-like [Nelumbo nucifera]